MINSVVISGCYKGIELDDVHRIIIIATKITFLSSKKSSNF